MSKSAKKAADQAEREKVHKRYSNRREPDVIYPAKKQVDFYDAVLRSTSEFQLIIWVRRLLMSSRRTIMRSLS